ncbi:kif21a protein, partial [Phlyctochytrium arcticum]
MATAGGSPSSPTLTAVQVALRVRPPPSSLTGRGARPVLSVVSTTDDTIPPTSVFVDGRKSFSFDRVYAPTDSTETLYNGSVRPLVSRFTEGYNTTILAYGQTGSGKTHTMLDTDGVVHRVARDVFGHFDQARDDKAVLERDITVSFIEIYNEDVLDLLVIPPSKGVVVREDPVKGIVWQGAREVVVEHPDDIIRNLESGLEFRQTVSTILNQTSSRSHAIFSINLRQRQWIPPTSEDDPADTGDWQIIHSKFHFVDLAGSERLKRTNAVGERQREGIHINSGLLALGNVINALGGGGPADHASHVPYRDSKLTRLLQDGLGGNSETLMIACASPCEADLGETLNTLKWANRGRNIHNSAVVNHEYQSEMRALKEQVAQLRDQV